MFNSDQRDHMDYLRGVEPENLCWCGWNKRGDCHSCPPEVSAADKLATRCIDCGGIAEAYGKGPVFHRVGCKARASKEGESENL